MSTSLENSVVATGKKKVSFLSNLKEGQCQKMFKVLVKVLVFSSCVLLFAAPWTVACQAFLSMKFYRQEYWSGYPCPSPGDLPNPGIKLKSPALQVGSLLSEPPGKPWECSNYHTIVLISHASKVMLKILQARLQQYMNWEIPDVQAEFRKGEEPEIKFPTSVGS